ncbi:MAG: hypothetical protein ABI640_00130 [Gammaproteobacteria bacterium]
MERQGQRHWLFFCTCAAVAFVCGVAGQDAHDAQYGEYRAPGPAVSQVEVEPSASAPQPETGESGRHSVLGNDDVVEMMEASFAESTILAAIAANDTSFDVSARALVALKTAGVSETVIEAMLKTESASRKAASAAKKAATQAAAEPSPSPAEVARLSAMIEQLAAKQDAAAAAQRPTEPPKSADPAPHAWVVNADDRTALPPTIAQVAFTDDHGAQRLKTLQSLAGTALVFVNPAVGGIATTIGGLFHPGNQVRTAIWALAGTAAPRDLGAAPAFEVEFGNIPGVDPDEYQPAIVRLVPTKDNYRLIAAAKTVGAKPGTPPDGPIVEEPVITQVTQLGRGRYRASASPLPTGEYALVLRPVDKDAHGRRKRRKNEASLGEMLGGGTTQVLYFTWDFGVSQ